MAVISYGELGSLREKHPGKKIIFCSGSFDLMHAGHVLFLEECKALGDILVVAVGPDADIRHNKGKNRPIHNEKIRLKIIDSLKPVDYSFIPFPLESGNHWLSPLRKIFEHLKPDMYVVNYDGGGMEYRKELTEELDIPLVILELDRNAPPYEGISTTAIIEKIRNLE